MKNQINIRASELLKRQLDELTEQLGTSITETVSLAIDRMYQQEIEIMPTINRNDAKGEWPSMLPEHTIYKWNDQLWTGRPYAQGYSRGIKLTPLTEDQRQYLDKRNVLKGLENY